MVGVDKRKYSDRQSFGPDGDGNLERTMLSRQPGQCAGLGEADISAIASIMGGTGKNHRSEGRRWQEYDLTITQMRRKLLRYIRLRERRSWAQDQLRFTYGFRNVRCDQCQADVMAAVDVLDEDAGAFSA